MSREAKEPVFRIHDESVNCYGFWVKTGGVDLAGFKRNPAMLWMHKQSNDQQEYLPIGSWKDVKVTANGEIHATPVFDLDDPFAGQIKNKMDKGIINMASIGFEILETSTANSDKKPGQTAPTVVKAELVEISICPFGANKNAIRLYKDGKALELNRQNVTVVLSAHHNPKNKLNMNLLQNLIEALSLDENADEQQVAEAVKALLKNIEDTRTQQAESLIDNAFEDGRLMVTKRDKYLTLAKHDLAMAQTVLEDMQPLVRPTDLINRKSGVYPSTVTSLTDKPRSQWNLEDYRRFAPKELESDPALYKRLIEREHGAK